MLKNDLIIAELSFNKSLDLLPNYPAAWLGLTELYLTKENNESAQEAYKRYKVLGGKSVQNYEAIAAPSGK